MKEDLSSEMTYRSYLVMKTVLEGVSIWAALEAVASVAIEHPEWDMNEVKTFLQWEAQRTGKTG